MAAATTNYWKLGLFVVLGVATAFGSLLWLGARQFKRESFQSVTYFDESVQGLDVGAPVRFRGVLIGNVATISLAPDRRRVEVESRIYVDAMKRFRLRLQHPEGEVEEPEMPHVPEDLRMQLVAQGITGVKFLQADFFDPKRFPPEKLSFATPPSYIPSVPSTLRSVEEAVLEASNYVPEIAGRVKALLEKIDREIDRIDTPALVRQTRSTLEAADLTLRAFDAAALATRTAAVLDEGRETLATLRRAAGELGGEKGQVAAALARVESSAAALERAIRDADVAATGAAFRKTAGTFGDTAKGLGELSDEVRADLVAFREAMDALRSLADMLERDPSALVHGKSPEQAPGGQKP